MYFIGILRFSFPKTWLILKFSADENWDFPGCGVVSSDDGYFSVNLLEKFYL